MTQANITIEDIPVSAPGIIAKLVKFQGQLDESNVDEKAKIIYDLLEQNPQNLYLLFDFEELEYMNSKSIGYLTDWYGKVTEGNGKIAIAKTRSNILDILQVVGLTQLINCYATLDEAKLALFQQPAADQATPAPSQPAPTQEQSAPAPQPEQNQPPSENAPAPEQPAPEQPAPAQPTQPAEPAAPAQPATPENPAVPVEKAPTPEQPEPTPEPTPPADPNQQNS